jgi:hypothetical protein
MSSNLSPPMSIMPSMSPLSPMTPATHMTPMYVMPSMLIPENLFVMTPATPVQPINVGFHTPIQNTPIENSLGSTPSYLRGLPSHYFSSDDESTETEDDIVHYHVLFEDDLRTPQKRPSASIPDAPFKR